MPPFIGRSTELRILRSAMDALASKPGRTRAVVLTGEPGVGKSRLLAEADIYAAGGHLVSLAGFEPERHVPLAAAQVLVRQVLTDPEVMRRDPLALFEAVHRGAGAAGITVLVVDDLQWVDERSLGLLHYLVRGALVDTQPLALIVASRPDPGSASFVEALRRLLADALTELVLGPLPEDEARAMAEGLAPGAGALAIAARAGGSPFWIEVLAGSGGDDREAFRLVEDRLGRLAGEDVELLALLALTGRPVPVLEAGEVLGWEPSRVLHALDRLVRAGVARAGLDGAAVSHDLIREAAASRLGDITRRRLHRALADSLERTANEDVGLLRQALEHRQAAGDRPAGLALRLATSPGRRLLGAPGLSDLFAIADQMPASAPLALDLSRALARLSSELGEHLRALEGWRRIVELDPDPSSRGAAAVAGARAAYVLEDLSQARDLLRTAHDCLARVPDVALAVKLDAVDASLLRWLEHQPARARLLEKRGLEAGRALASDRGLQAMGARERGAYLEAVRAAHGGAMQDNQHNTMLSLAEEMRHVAAGVDEASPLEADTLVGVAQMMLGLTLDAEKTFRAIWEESGRRSLPEVQLESGHFLATTLIYLGRLDAARTVAEATTAMARRVGEHLRFAIRIGTPLAVLEVLSGEWRAGLRMLEDDVSATSDPHPRIATRLEAAIWRARIEGPAAASHVKHLVTEVRRDARAARCRRCDDVARVVSAEALALVGADSTARRFLDRWDGHPPPALNLWDRIHAGRARARLSATPASLTAVSGLAEEAERSGWPIEQAWTLIVLADSLGPDNRPAAVAALRQARELADAAGAVTISSLAAQRARALGVRTWRRSAARRSGPGAELSRREREIADHIATGESNAQIADALFLSRRTVDRHVENILRKLVLPNRVAVAAWVRDGGTAIPNG
jgi:DNA-binding CsgD family transcriptional regulator/tetratricopeptide (TPR) repeat protein